ncbi:MAG: hypothetical protein IMY84_04035 [Chloroflexi bacterium]|nr:hypothetical protein [Chloroflexota bacterium]
MRRQENMMQHLARTQLYAALDTLPMELTFVDAKDCVRFWNKHEARESGS